jgi:hypothetical protein
MMIRTEADRALVALPDFKSGREAEMSPGGSIPSRFRHVSCIPSSSISLYIGRVAGFLYLKEKRQPQ